MVHLCKVLEDLVQLHIVQDVEEQDIDGKKEEIRDANALKSKQKEWEEDVILAVLVLIKYILIMNIFIVVIYNRLNKE